jgi:GNAT superfamily N-acetyltransferase
MENAVSLDFRGMGIGTKMYEFVLDKMRTEGMKYASVSTGLDDGHAAARRSYEKAGFEKNLPSIKYFMEL